MTLTRIALTVVFVGLFVHYFISYCYTDDIVLDQGTLKGIALNGYNVYFGIPYATVPKRFGEPGSAPSWSNIFYATNGNVQCNQVLPILKIAVGQEDCLVLNIFTPDNSNKSFPVMVFIHGGAFQFGSNANFLYDAKYLAQKDVVVVSINYRLGPFGFLCLNKTEAAGNMAFKDQIAALQWVQRNIEKFGGDPTTVTLVGESAGATSVQYISMSDLAKGLFKRIILQSGSILVPIGYDENPVHKAVVLASKLGHNTTDVDEILEILQNVDSTELTNAAFADMKNNVIDALFFQPCAENEKVSKNAFLVTNPKQLLREKMVDPNLNVLMGFNDKEGIMFAGQYDTVTLKNVQSGISKILPRNLVFRNESEKLEFLEDIRTLYFGENAAEHDSYHGLIQYFSDCLIVYPSMETLDYYSKGNATVFNYIFKYDSFRNLNKFVSGLPLTHGANHADELFYIFDPYPYKLLPTIVDEEKVDFMTTAWTNFIKSGDPGYNWLKSEKDEIKFLSIENDGIRMTATPFMTRVEFWRNAYKKYGAF